MKQIIILILFCFTTACKAQSPIFTLGEPRDNTPNGCYVKDNAHLLDRFVGTWMYIQNGNIFKVTLNKGIEVPINDHYRDDIQGKYEYIINGNTIVNTENYTGNNSKIRFTFLNNNPNKISLFFDDPERPKIGAKVILIYSNIGGIEKLNWELIVTGYLPTLPGEQAPQLDFRVPINCELIKQ